jgi:hypothetical protein
MDVPPLHEDLLTGAQAIAEFTGLSVRRVYYLSETGDLPVFRLGQVLQARKSELNEALSAKARPSQATT